MGSWDLTGGCRQRGAADTRPTQASVLELERETCTLWTPLKQGNNALAPSRLIKLPGLSTGMTKRKALLRNRAGRFSLGNTIPLRLHASKGPIVFGTVTRDARRFR